MSVRFDVAAHPGALAYKLLAGLVVPRPIALVTTIDAAGVVNAAPFSFFNVMGTEPAIAVFAAMAFACSSVTTRLFWAGERDSGVSDALVQMPDMSGLPSGVRGTCARAGWASAIARAARAGLSSLISSSCRVVFARALLGGALSASGRLPLNGRSGNAMFSSGLTRPLAPFRLQCMVPPF